MTKIEAAAATAARLGIFRTMDFVDAGFPREYLRRLKQRGIIHRAGPGLYAAHSLDGDQHQTLLEASIRFPAAVVCLLSALQFHEMGTQAPFQVWLALPVSMRLPRLTQPLPIQFCKFSPASHRFGLKRYPVRGGSVPVYDPAKTVADCFKYRNKVGIDVAVEALREGWREKKFTLTEVMHAANACRVGKVIQPYLEMLA